MAQFLDGTGLGRVWTRMKTYVATAIGGKADKVSSPTTGNFAGLDANGNITDSGSKASDFVTSSAVSGKMDSDFSNASAILDISHGGTGNADGYIRTGQKSGSTVGDGSTCEGHNTIASGYYSHAEGSATCASGSYSHAEGAGTCASDSYSHAEGSNTCASNNSSHAEGAATCSYGAASHAEGAGTCASGDCSHAEGTGTCARGEGSHAEGTSTTANNPTIAYGKASHAEGMGTYAYDEAAHAEGFITTASGLHSHAEGSSTCAGGSYSHAEGSFTRASGDYSHAGGHSSQSLGHNSFVHGDCLKSENNDQVLFGNGYAVNYNPKYSTFTNGNTDTSSTIENKFAVLTNRTKVRSINSSNGYGDPDRNDSYFTRGCLLNLDDFGNLYLHGAMYKARGTIRNTLVASGRNITLEPGAIYALYCVGWTTSSGAFRGINAYVVGCGIGTSTTALAAPRVASIGTTGSACCRLSATYGNSSTPYVPVLGIGCCTTAITIRYTLVKVSGSTDDFPTA